MLKWCIWHILLVPLSSRALLSVVGSLIAKPKDSVLVVNTRLKKERKQRIGSLNCVLPTRQQEGYF